MGGGDSDRSEYESVRAGQKSIIGALRSGHTLYKGKVLGRGHTKGGH